MTRASTPSASATLAGRLGVQAPTLYWHIGSKAELLDALADAIMDDAIRAVPESRPDDDWADWLLTALVELRAAMLRHRDGARIVSGARQSLRRGDFSESAMSTLVDHGIELQRARLLVLAGERFTVGYVLEEQAPHGRDPASPRRRRTATPFPGHDPSHRPILLNRPQLRRSLPGHRATHPRPATANLIWGLHVSQPVKHTVGIGAPGGTRTPNPFLRTELLFH